MPKLSPDRVPAYRLHKQSGQAIVTLSGRDHLLGARGSAASRRLYDRLVAEWIANGRRGVTPGAGLTVSTLIATFWKHAQTYYVSPDGGPGSELSNFESVLRVLRRLYGPTRCADFGPLALKATRQAMVELGWARSNVNRQTTRLRQVFKWAAENELIPPSVHHGLSAVGGLRRGRTAARETAPVRPVPEAHVYAIRPFVSHQVWAMVELQLITGMRSGEVTALRAVDVNTAGPVWVYSPPRHKTAHHGHARNIGLGPRAQQILAPFMAGRPVDAYVFSPAEAEAERRERVHAARKTPMSCGNRPGSNRRAKLERTPRDRYAPTVYLNAIYAGCAKAFPPPEPLGKRDDETHDQWRTRLTAAQAVELRAWTKDHRWHAHRLRHSAATRIRASHGLEAARALLGQRSIGVTEMYAEVDQAKVEQIMREVG